MSTKIIAKTLSANDTGETGAHMGGVLIPREDTMLSFFPRLDGTIKNPREIVDVVDDVGRDWTFQFIYYNGKFFGGTRNEYRLTGMTAFLREFNLKAGDILVFRKEGRDTFVSYRRAGGVAGEQEATGSSVVREDAPGSSDPDWLPGMDKLPKARRVLRLGGNWKVIQYDE